MVFAALRIRAGPFIGARRRWGSSIASPSQWREVGAPLGISKVEGVDASDGREWLRLWQDELLNETMKGMQYLRSRFNNLSGSAASKEKFMPLVFYAAGPIMVGLSFWMYVKKSKLDKVHDRLDGKTSHKARNQSANALKSETVPAKDETK